MLNFTMFSRELRKALDISSKELPEFIYRMRGLGYPPGWMQEALNKESGISIFDKDGNGKQNKIAPLEIHC